MNVTINHKEIKRKNFGDLCQGDVFLFGTTPTPFIKTETVVDDYDCTLSNAVSLFDGTTESFDAYDMVTIPESEELVISY